MLLDEGRHEQPQDPSQHVGGVELEEGALDALVGLSGGLDSLREVLLELERDADGCEFVLLFDVFAPVVVVPPDVGRNEDIELRGVGVAFPLEVGLEGRGEAGGDEVVDGESVALGGRLQRLEAEALDRGHLLLPRKSALAVVQKVLREG